MLRFNQKVFDNYINGTQPVYSQTAFSELLGSVEHLTLAGQFDGVSGTNTGLTVQCEHSFDGTRWFNRQSIPELLWNVGQGNWSVGPTSDELSSEDRPTLPLVRLRIQIGGAAPLSGVLRLWAMGRDPTF